MSDVKIGKYKHFKGHLAKVIGVAKHSETKEEFVIYEHIEVETGNSELWVRPKKMFLETVEVNGKLIPRFEFVNEA